MDKNFKLHFKIILDSINKITKYVDDLSFDEFKMEDAISNEVIRKFETISKVSRNIPKTIRAKSPLVEWQQIDDFTIIMSHEYYGINYEIMWDVIKNKLPELKQHVEYIIGNEECFLL